MIEEKLKNTVVRSSKLVIIILILTWLSYLYGQMKTPFFFDYPVIFPVVTSVTAILLVLIIYFHIRNITLNLNKLLENERKNRFHAKSQFLDNIGHELRTPMIGIMGSADLLKHSALDTEQKAHLDTIKACGGKLLNLIDMILDMSRNSDLPGNDPTASGYDCIGFAGGTDYTSDYNYAYLFNQFLPVNILLVEDNDLNQKLITQMLVSYGFEVETVSNGLECLQILQGKDFHLILMDMQMPILDGYETTRKIRANSCYDHIPVIAITANTLSYDLEKCMECGCSSYLPKPFTADELAQEIKAHLKIDHTCSLSTQPADELIIELLPEFIEILAEMLEDLHRAVEHHDMPTIQELSHAIKGTAGMYGFMQISATAALIEQAGKGKIHSQIPLLINQLDRYYQQIIIRQQTNIVG